MAHSPVRAAPPAVRGLTTAEAAARLVAGGPNAVARPRPRSLLRRVLRQFADPLVALLLAAAAVTTALGDWPDTAVILLVVVVNTAIGVTQEVRADQAIAALDRLTAPTARVIRDGVDAVVPAVEIVPGDAVRLDAGDIVPADLTLHSAHRLQLDESALTGESVAVLRAPGDEALAGTVVVAGRAVGVTVRTGAASALGRIATLVSATRRGRTPLQRRLAGLGRVLGLTALLLSGVVFAIGVAGGRPVIDMAITAVSLVVAAVPESLPAVVTLALALGARRMARARAIPRRLHAVETLGSVTVVASDKTGTLTEGRMAVQRAITPDGVQAAPAGTGYDPSGTVDGGGTDLLHLARAGLLCNDATITAPDPEHPDWRPIGDPMEAALVTFAARCGLDRDAERVRWPRVTEQPFEQATRRMTTVHRGPDGDWLVICKGAPESVLTVEVLAEPPATLDEARATAHRLAAEGLRVLALAAATAAEADAIDPAAPAGLRLLGLIGVGDPIRSAAPQIADAFLGAGIRLVLITGDHPATAAAIAGRLGIWRDGDDIVRGAESEDTERAGHASVYARIQPEQKLGIVRALQAGGEVVAMTGDGVNDAPALRQADIGVAMGGGTEVARQAADLVLVDDNLATVAKAVGEGRRIYDNIRRFLRYGLAGGAAEILVMLLGPLAGLAVPLLPAQILWINLLTHGVPGVALGAEPAEPGIMDRPPRSPQESVLGGGLLRGVLLAGGLIAAVTLAAGAVADRLDLPWQSMLFVVLGLAQLGVAWAVRAPRSPGHRANPGLAWAIAASGLLQVAGVLLPPLRTLLGTEPLTLLQLLACVAVAALPGLGVWALGRRTRTSGRSALAGRTGPVDGRGEPGRVR